MTMAGMGAGIAANQTTIDKTASTGWVLDAIAMPIKQIFNAILGSINDIKKKIELGDFTGAIIAALPIITIVLGAFVVLDLLTTHVLGFGLDLSGIKAALKDILKIDLLISAVVGAWIGAGLKSPAEQIANKIFRPSILSVSAATDLRVKGKISDGVWRDVLSRWGVPDGHMAYLLDMADRKPEMSMALKAFSYFDIDESALRWLMVENGYTMPQVQTFFIKYFHAVRLRDEMSAYLGYLKADYQAGLISSTQLEAELKLFKSSGEEIDQIVVNEENKFMRTLTKSEQEACIWLYRKGVYAGIYQVLTLKSLGYVNCVTSDIDRQVKDDGAEIGTLVEFDNTNRIWLIDSDVTIAINSAITITDGTGEGSALIASTAITNAEDTLYQALALLGINSALVNALVRLEAAKKGIDWEHE